MASGKVHDLSILFTTPSVAITSQVMFNNPLETLTLSGLYLISGLYLSPDVDMRSNPFKRWGIIRFIWIPYQKAFPHRGKFFNRNFWTHAPIIATIIRITYLFSILTFLGILVNLFTQYSMNVDIQKVISLVIKLLVMCEIASFLHLCLDVFETKRKGH